MCTLSNQYLRESERSVKKLNNNNYVMVWAAPSNTYVTNCRLNFLRIRILISIAGTVIESEASILAKNK